MSGIEIGILIIGYMGLISLMYIFEKFEQFLESWRGKDER